MKQADIDILIQQGEGTTLEFKENLSGSFAREVVALANTTGGRILLGVRDNGTVARIRDSNALRARIQDVARNCDPPVKVLVEPVGEVIVIHVRESDGKPVQCSDGFFWRQGRQPEALRDEFATSSVSRAIRFDRAPCRFRWDFSREVQRLMKLSVSRTAAHQDAGEHQSRMTGAGFFSTMPACSSSPRT
jgi:ATP-dependent DNA helicase RecG